jgi:DNA ligase-1
MGSLPFRYERGGILLPSLGLWLDASDPQTGSERVFVSHAHSDHTALHREVILSEPTSRLMQARLGGQRVEHVLPFGQEHVFDSAETAFRLTLLPAGHIFGSAMSLIEWGGRSLLYTGDFKLRRGLSAEPCDSVRAREVEMLIMETTYGRPEYRFPPTDEVMRGVVRFCQQALDNDETPVLLGYSLGKSQELLRGLAEVGAPIMLHGAVYNLTKIYEQLGQSFPPYGRYDPATARGKVLVCPPNVAHSTMLRNLGRRRTAVLTGWAVDQNCRFRYQADAAFPLSDHADFPELVKFVQDVSPGKVFTVHGFAADFAQTLRELGYDAQALSEDEQLALPIVVSSPGFRASSCSQGAEHAISLPTPATFSSASGQSSPDSFALFAETCEAMAATARKLEKIRVLSNYLSEVPAVHVRTVVVWFTGTPFASTENQVMQLGWAILTQAICSVAAIEDAEFRQVYLKHSDLGEAALEALEHRQVAGGALSLSSVQEFFRRIQAARGPTAKLPLFIETLQCCSALEAKFLIKIITSDLRIGLKEGLLEEAIGAAFSQPPEAVRRANLLLGHVGEVAELARGGNLESATIVPFRPVKFMLASPEPTAAAIWERWQRRTDASPVGEALAVSAAAARSETIETRECSQDRPDSCPTLWLEDKYDGIRCQIHKMDNRAALYSRDLKDITATFPELEAAARGLRDDVVLDGEILAMRDDVLPFAELQKRLGRREGDLFLDAEIPIRFIAFDLLWLNGKSLLDSTLAERRAALERFAPLPLRFQLARVTMAHSSADIEAAFHAARSRNNEGLMAKDPRSLYTPGRRGFAWVKLKKALATLDCIVVGAEYGHGKRKSVLSDYTFAVRDETTGELKTIGKAYTGLTDAEIEQLTGHFLTKTIRRHGRYHEVEPDTVLEIAFDRIQPSTRHTSGLALRFPRIVRIRSDKSPAEIDTLAAARKLAEATVQPGGTMAKDN